MPDFFRERLRRDLSRLTTPSGRVDIARMMAGWSSDQEWVRTSLRLPPAERRRVLAELGRETFQRDWGRYASELRGNTENLDFLWSRDEREELLCQHTELLFAGVADRVAFGDPAESRQALDEVDFSGLENIESAHACGNGIMMLSVHQSHPAFGLNHSALEKMEFCIVFHETADDSSGLSAMLQGISHRVDLLRATPSSVRRMLRMLGRGGCVAIYNDFVFPESQGVATGLFGQRVWISRSAVAIALRTRAAVVPVTIARQYPPDTGRVRVEMFEPLPLEDLDRGSDGDVKRAAFRLGIATECLIRRHPAQWTLWNTLLHRGARAEAAQSTCAADDLNVTPLS